MRNTITKDGVFATPESMDKLSDWIERHPPEDRVSLFTAAGMMRNLCSTYGDKMVEVHDAIESDLLELVLEMRGDPMVPRDLINKMLDLLGMEGLDEAEKEAEHSYDMMWLHKPRLDPEELENGCESLVDCCPTTGDGVVSEEEFEKAVKENRVWTELDGDLTVHVAPGYHYVNRLRHFITEIPYKLVEGSDDPLEVHMSDFPEDCRRQ